MRRLGAFRLSSLIVMGGYVLSRMTGLLRDVIISAQFGTSDSLAAYYAAFRITDFLYMVIIGGALGSTFIPIFITIFERDGAARAWRLASTVVTWALGVLAAASALLWLLAPWLSEALFAGPDFGAEELAITTGMTRLFLFSPLLLGLGGLAMATLNAQDRFALPALAPAVYNLGIIGGAVLLAPWLGVWGLGWGVVIGAALYLGVQIPGLLRVGMRLRFTLGADIPERGEVARQMLPRVLGQGASQISLLVTASLTATYLLADQLAGLNYAYQLMLLPYGVFSLSLSTVAFPLMARLFADDNMTAFQARVRSTLATILFFTLPAMVALLLLGVPLVRLVFQRGAFDNASLLYTYEPLLGYALALPAFAAAEILIRSFYAMQKTLVPVGVGLLQVAMNIGLGLFAIGQGYGVVGLTLAFSIANTAETVLLALLLRRSIPGIWADDTLWRSLLASGAAAAALGGLLYACIQLSLPAMPYLALGGAYAWQHDTLALLVWLVVVGGLGAGCYVLMTGLLGVPDARAVLRRGRALVQR